MIHLVLPADVDPTTTTLIAAAMRTAAGAIVIDGVGVERIGPPGLQLLLTLRARADDSGGSLAITRPSPSLRTAIRTFGADPLLYPTIGG